MRTLIFSVTLWRSYGSALPPANVTAASDSSTSTVPPQAIVLVMVGWSFLFCSLLVVACAYNRIALEIKRHRTPTLAACRPVSVADVVAGKPISPGTAKL